mmetsp:Transcript_5515/g.10715  ORF Transcript_5515/g.10715 Transcript_5515/m.10715 type:complete len:325 (-) Transcript_5515:92-1066(-)
MSLEQAQQAIPAVVRMFSGCEDKQTSADVSNVASFKLPDPAGRAGGALTSALLNVTYADHKDTGKDLTFKETLYAVRTSLQGKGFEQTPQLSSSRPTDLEEHFAILPKNFAGKRRAVMIGINYTGDNPGELRGCHNDVHNMKEYIKNCHGFTDADITLLLDDGKNTAPTAANILAAFKKLASEAKAGDACFVHYSGHGCSIRDDDGDEADGMDEALCPVDYKKSGVLRDDDVLEKLIAPLPRGVTLTCIMDCCHSGTILDLPYLFLADGMQEQMQPDPDFDFGPLITMVSSFAKLGFEGLKKLHKQGKVRRKKERQWLKNRLGL